MRPSGPIFGGDEDEVACRIFHVRVRAPVDAELRKSPLEPGVRRRGVRVPAEVVAEEERIPLIRPAGDTDVQIRGAAGARLEEELLPVQVRAMCPRRPVVLGDLSVDEACLGERRGEKSAIESSDGHLYVDDILRRKTGNRSRADVIDAEREVAEGGSQSRGDHFELCRPACLRFDDADRRVRSG